MERPTTAQIVALLRDAAFQLAPYANADDDDLEEMVEAGVVEPLAGRLIAAADALETEPDTRYEYVKCSECGLSPQRIDWKNPNSHKVGCSIPSLGGMKAAGLVA